MSRLTSFLYGDDECMMSFTTCGLSAKIVGRLKSFFTQYIGVVLSINVYFVCFGIFFTVFLMCRYIIPYSFSLFYAVCNMGLVA